MSNNKVNVGLTVENHVAHNGIYLGFNLRLFKRGWLEHPLTQWKSWEYHPYFVAFHCYVESKAVHITHSFGF